MLLIIIATTRESICAKSATISVLPAIVSFEFLWTVTIGGRSV